MTEWIPIAEGMDFLKNFKLEFLEKKGITYYYHIFYKKNVVALYKYSVINGIEEKNIKLLRPDIVTFREVFDFIGEKNNV